MSDASVLLIAEMHGLVGRERELRALLEDLAASARQDTGCLSYHVAAALGEPGELLVVAQWRDEAALRAHYATDGYRSYRSAVGELLARPSDVVVHHVAVTIRARDPNPPDPGLFG
jgi:quinol monooxygenase YgiN